ncbi:MAG: lipid A export permease/ATP-binding protein MsbA [Zetaproteobacteria bacterium]|nr:lipid A export permease/ATP-binding protein MsbA [Zetaproteobacteria bacterium]
MNHLYRRLLQFLKPYKGRLFVAMFCMVVLAACTAALAWMLKPALDQALAGGNQRYIYLIPLGIIGLYFIKGIAYYGQSYFMAYIGQRVITDLRNYMYDRLTSQSLSFFAHRKTGEILARIGYDVTLVQGAVSTAITALMRDVATIIFLTAVILYQDWKLALMSMMLFPLVIYPIARFGKKIRHATSEGQVSMGEMTSLVEETIGGVRVVKAFGMEAYEQRRFRALTQRFFSHQMRAMRVQALSFPIMELLAGFCVAGVLYYGGSQVAAGFSTPGALMSFLAAMIMLYEPVKRLSAANNQIQQGLSAAERIFDLADEEIAVVDCDDAVDLSGNFVASVAFESVQLKYPNAEKAVLDHIHFSVAPGEVVALVGKSGAGKTSLASLVPRFLDVSAGVVRVSGEDVRHVTQDSLRQHIALVTQEVILFNDTVLNNVAYGHDEIDREKVIAVAKAANAHEFIMKMPQGYDTLVGERGVILSGGQRQRISLARALLKDAPILILDEATSSLDTESERLVQEAIDRLMQGRTVIVIAHRLSTIRHADKIVVLDHGQVAQMGQHELLLQEGGLYSELYHMQFEQQGDVDSVI